MGKYLLILESTIFGPMKATVYLLAVVREVGGNVGSSYQVLQNQMRVKLNVRQKTNVVLNHDVHLLIQK